MSNSEESPMKKIKLDVPSDKGSVIEKKQRFDISAMNIRSNKFQLLLPTVYPLNKSRCKSIIIGLQVEYATHKVRPVVGIFDHKNQGIIFSESSWKEFSEHFDDFNLWIEHGRGEKLKAKLGEPSLYKGFSITPSYLNFNWIKSRIIGIREYYENITTGSDTNLPSTSSSSSFPSSAILMQKVTFDVLRDLSPLVNEYIIYLNTMIECVKKCIDSLIDEGQNEIKGIQEITDTSKWGREVLERIARDCFRRFKVDQMKNLNENIPINIYKRVLNELYVFYDAFLTHNVINV